MKQVLSCILLLLLLSACHPMELFSSPNVSDIMDETEEKAYIPMTEELAIEREKPYQAMINEPFTYENSFSFAEAFPNDGDVSLETIRYEYEGVWHPKSENSYGYSNLQLFEKNNVMNPMSTSFPVSIHDNTFIDTSTEEAVPFVHHENTFHKIRSLPSFTKSDQTVTDHQFELTLEDEEMEELLFPNEMKRPAYDHLDQSKLTIFTNEDDDAITDYKLEAHMDIVEDGETTSYQITRIIHFSIRDTLQHEAASTKELFKSMQKEQQFYKKEGGSEK